ncbi:hypothetical protein Hanom_Chr04g00382961 [Helianthus anomalus]
MRLGCLRPEKSHGNTSKNKTLNKREKSMRRHAGLPKMCWVDSLNTAAYLTNQRPPIP